jgi:hypothetical protein
LFAVAPTIFPSFKTSRTFSNLVPEYSVGVLNRITPFTEFFTGQEKTSPSGMLRSPLHILAPMFLMLNVKSVPGALRWTLSARFIRFSSGIIARAIFA